MKHIVNKSDSAINKKEIIKLILNTENNSELTLSGGEPGLISKEFLEKIIKIAKFKNLKLFLNTNGLFLERYKEYIKCFNMINLHFDFNFLRPYNNINYVVIITEQNFNTIESKLRQFNIKYDLIPSTNYNLIPNSYTLKQDLLKFRKYMTEQSINFYINNDRYNVRYLN